jgi:hypothetical protein
MKDTVPAVLNPVPLAALSRVRDGSSGTPAGIALSGSTVVAAPESGTDRSDIAGRPSKRQWRETDGVDDLSLTVAISREPDRELL